MTFLTIIPDAGESVCKRLVFSGASTAKQLQQFVESNIYHRQGMQPIFLFFKTSKEKLKVSFHFLNMQLFFSVFFLSLSCVLPKNMDGFLKVMLLIGILMNCLASL